MTQPAKPLNHKTERELQALHFRNGQAESGTIERDWRTLDTRGGNRYNVRHSPGLEIAAIRRFGVTAVLGLDCLSPAPIAPGVPVAGVSVQIGVLMCT